MESERVVPDGRAFVQGYDADGFRIAGRQFRAPVIIVGRDVITLDGAGAGAVTLEALAPLRAAEPPVEILVFGQGAAADMLDPAFRAGLKEWGIVVEAMTTPAACRTFNLLAGENRNVAAVLVPTSGAG